MIPAAHRHLPPLVTIEIARRAVGVSRRTIYNWMAAGQVEFVFTAGGQRQIVTETLWRAEQPALAAGNGGVRVKGEKVVSRG